MLGLRLAVAALAVAALVLGGPAAASHTPAPASVTIAGSLQSELGCPGDWQPGCAATQLAYDAGDGVWQGTFTVPAGSWEYKAPVNGSWDENYGRYAQQNGPNVPLTLGAATAVKFYYDPATHWLTDDVSSTIATVPGSFQSELGCPGDWQPDCLRSWLQDADEDGVYTFTTSAIPPGSYEAKVAIGEGWAENYGAGGVPGGANIPFTVPAGGVVAFSYDAGSHVLSISVTSALPSRDGNVEWDGLRHDSRDPLYRTPGGAVPAGTPVTLRFRTFSGDVTGVKARVYDVNAAVQRLLPMRLAAEGVDCYQPSLAGRLCDFWEVTLPNASANNLWYRFVVSDGPDTDYYADDTPALDGGLGRTTDDAVDQSWALTVYEPGFQAPAWVRDAVVYQIFPDRFRNGNPGNDPVPGAADRKRWSSDPRYAYPSGDPGGAAQPAWDRIAMMGWNERPEGYCRNYAAGACPQRFPQPAADREQPRGRDYYGGDLKGVTQKLDYLRSLGVTAVYFNPIFDAASNHGYDTQDYTRIDPYFGTLDQWTELERAAAARGIRIVLDGVFNHLSSDSPFFDRYRRYREVGACESAASPYRAWFTFRAPSPSEPAPCAPSAPGGADAYYAGWFNFDSIPVLTKTLPAVQSYFLSGPGAIAGLWLGRGADGWRLDVSGDPSFPAGYWERFRQVVKAEKPDAWTVSETWQKDTTLLRALRGDRFDATMNYRLRDAVIGLLAPGSFDSKGLADSGRPLAPSEFAARLLSQREDYADAAYYSAMNLIDSHDTERALWTLTPGEESAAGRELDAANLAAGKARLRLASLIQFTLPGAPTVYYGDEAGVTGDDDPDNRRTYPWADEGGSPDAALVGWYRSLGRLRGATGALRGGDLRILVADDAKGVVAYGRKLGDQAAIVVVNRSGGPQTVDLPLAGWVPASTSFGNGVLSGLAYGPQVTVPPLSGDVFVSAPGADLTPPAAPAGLAAAEGSGQVSLSWDAAPGAASYAVYRSPLSGGGYVAAGTTDGTSLVDTGVENGRLYYYVVRALDARGNESASSAEATALPHLTIGWANTQWPPSMTHTISATDRTDSVYGQVWIDGATSAPGPTPGLRAQLGFGPAGSPVAGWTWVDAEFNGDVGNNDEFKASLLPEATGTYAYAYRYSTTGGRDWLYADLSGPVAGEPGAPGLLRVDPSGDTEAPPAPAGLRVVTASPVGIELAWDAVAGDPSLYGYEVRRAPAAGGAFERLALVTATSYTDTDVVENETYRYVVRALDGSFNFSGDSNEAQARAELRTVTVVFTVTVPASTDGTGRSVYVAGTLSRLAGGLPDWDPGGVVLTRLDATRWRVTLTGKETTQIEYKYTLGDWEHVEKDSACGEISNRMLTLSYGAGGTQAVSDSVPNWRNVAPCGN